MSVMVSQGATLGRNQMRSTWDLSVLVLTSACESIPTSIKSLIFKKISKGVTESGVWLLATQKLLKRPGWWKGEFALVWMLATGVGGVEGGCVSKGRLPPSLTISGQELL